MQTKADPLNALNQVGRLVSKNLLCIQTTIPETKRAPTIPMLSDTKPQTFVNLGALSTSNVYSTPKKSPHCIKIVLMK